MKKIHSFLVLVTLLSFQVKAQHKLTLNIELDTLTHVLNVKQDIVYFNTSQDSLKTVFFHDWANAFSDKNSDLGKRFVENYKKKFFFTNEKNRGHTTLFSAQINGKPKLWNRQKKYDDFFRLDLEKPLLPKDSLQITLIYKVKIPHSKFTDYGVNKDEYNLKNWCITPAVYTDKWEIMHHLDMDDLYQDPINYFATLKLPKSYLVESNLNLIKIKEGFYRLKGQQLNNFELFISKNKHIESYYSDAVHIVTNMNTITIDDKVKADIINRQFQFLQSKLGRFPHEKLFLNKIAYNKNPLYGFNQLPGFLRPFSDTFEWDLRLFKVLIKNFINDSYTGHTREDIWLKEALQSYLMIQYVDSYYPEVKLIGGISELWGVKSYHIADLDFNARYNTVYQYVARYNLDQAINTPADSLTNFNRLVANKYKAGLGLRYLDNYLENDIVASGIKAWFEATVNGENKEVFEEAIKTNTTKDVDWFFDEFINTNTKIDYTISKPTRQNDSLFVTIKNKTNSKAPISFCVLQNDSIISQKWLTSVGRKKTLSFPYNKSCSFQLNNEFVVPEVNFSNNFTSVKTPFFKKPLHVRWLGDAEDANAHQLIFEPNFTYNFYDGFVLATTFSNKVLEKKNFKFEATPAFGFKSKSLTGFFKLRYWKHINHPKINSYKIGVGGSYFHYKPSLAYKTLTPYARLYFKRKNLRSVKSSSVTLSYTLVDREIDADNIGQTINEENKYNILSLGYGYYNPEIINNFSYFANLELGSNFSKLYSTIRFRKLTNSKRQFDVRLFTGLFLHNNTQTDFFSFGVNRPNDYRFRYHYFGRSEESGLLSQQVIITDAGFKSQMPVSYANQWETSINTSIGLWRWIEIYNDFGFVKNRGDKLVFLHDKGVRLNFVNDIFEVYFPLHSNNGWEIAQPHYEERIRFVFSANFSRIYNFMRRGFM